MKKSQLNTAAIFVALISFLMTAGILAQDKNGTQTGKMKMDKNMKIDHNQMKKENDVKEFDLKAIDENKDGKVYQCPMDVDVLSDKPGIDPNCGMALEEVSLIKAADNLVEHGLKLKGETNDNTIVHEGVINLKGIDKNKDGKVYQDMMDYNVISDEPGNCPLCGMKLKEVSIDKAEEILLKNGFEVNNK